MKAAGGALGAGIVIALPATACPIAETARVVRYLAEESAWQCGPCLFGLPALADALAGLAYSGGSRGRDRGIDDIAALIPLIEGRGYLHWCGSAAPRGGRRRHPRCADPVPDRTRARGNQHGQRDDRAAARASSPPDLVLLDLGLPDLGGYEALRMLRAISRSRSW